MSVFHNKKQIELEILWNPRNSRRELSNSREFPPGIFDVADSRDFPNGNSRRPCFWASEVSSCTKFPGPHHSRVPVLAVTSLTRHQLGSPWPWHKPVHILVMGKSIRQAESIQYHSYHHLFLATCITVLQDYVMAHIRVNVATHFCKGTTAALFKFVAMRLRAGQSWLGWTGPAASRPESRTLGVDCGWGFEFWQWQSNESNRIESNSFLFCRIAHHYVPGRSGNYT